MKGKFDGLKGLCVLRWMFPVFPDEAWGPLNCCVGHKFEDPQRDKQNCPCEAGDYERCVSFVDQNPSISQFVRAVTITSFRTAISMLPLALDLCPRISVQETTPTKSI